MTADPTAAPRLCDTVLPTPADLSPLVDLTAQLASRAAREPLLAAPLHAFAHRAVGFGLGGGARSMHARLDGHTVAPDLPDLDSPEALALTAACALVLTDLTGERPLRVPGPARCPAWFEQLDRTLAERMRTEPDVLDAFLLHASRLGPRVPALRDHLTALGEQLAAAHRELGRAGDQLVEAFAAAELEEPFPDRGGRWSRALTVAVAAVWLSD